MIHMSTIKKLLFLCIVLLFAGVPAAGAMNIVATTTVYADPISAIGGEHVSVTTIADPTVCPHLQGDIIDTRIQMQKGAIVEADYFFHHNSPTMDNIAKQAVDRFLDANFGRTPNWITTDQQVWNTPELAAAFAGEIKEILVTLDQAHADQFEANYHAYIRSIEAGDLSAEEKERIGGQDAIVMVWQRDAAESWLGLNVVSIFGPEFYMQGRHTPVKVIDDINANPERYRNVRYVIENMQSGEMAKGIEEALHDHGIMAERVIFTNFPRSLPGADSIPGIIAHNKALVDTGTEPAAPKQPGAESTPMTLIPVIGALSIIALHLKRRK